MASAAMTVYLLSVARWQMDRTDLYEILIPVNVKRAGLALTATCAIRTRRAML
jgi:PHD/YefM family antitoxin component YafN of YafNO toxin-antitoxin module